MASQQHQATSVSLPKTRRVWRRTDTKDPNAPLLELKEEALPDPVPPGSVLIKVHTISLNWRDVNITHGQNPWPVIPNGIPGSDAVGTVIAVGRNDGNIKSGDVVTPIIDQCSITGREQERRWLVADVDGVMAEYLIMEEQTLVKIPAYLCKDGKGLEEAAALNCAGVTAWSVLKGVRMGEVVLVQGTGGVSMMALKLARAMGCGVILTSSSDEKLQRMRERYSDPPLLTANYAKNENWHEEVLELNGGVGVDVVLDNGGTSSLVRSMKCTRRGGVISQVGYLGKQNPKDLEEMLSVLIDRRVNLRGINGGSKHDLEDLYAAVAATQLRFGDIIDARYPFERAEEAIEHVWRGRQVGKVVITI